MDDEKEDSDNTTAASTSDSDDEKQDNITAATTSGMDTAQPQVSTITSCKDHTRTQTVTEQNVNISSVHNYHALSHNKNVVIGNQIVNTIKSDGRASNMKVSTTSRINSVDWNLYVETRAEEIGVELLKKNGVVIVIGCPGSGKTTLALSIMRQIEKEEKTESYLLTHHTEFNDIPVSREKKCIILIDDIFGKTNLILDFRLSWQPKFPMVWSLVQDGSVKCIITLRNQIFAESKTSLNEFDLFNENHLLDLQSHEFCLSYDEKEEILNKYLRQKDVTMEEHDKWKVIQRSCTELGFPQVCVYYVNSCDAQKRGVKFFKKPVEYLREQLGNMKNDQSSQINYLVLLLIMFQQGSLSIDLLNPFGNDSDIMKLVRALEGACLSLKHTNLAHIKTTADVMCGTYLNCYNNRYTFIHQSVFDSLFLMFSSEFPKKAAELLEVCPVSMLLEYVVTPGVSNKSHITMIVQPDCFDVLACRFTDLLASSSAREIISHPSLKDEEFLKYLIEKKHFYGKLSKILHQNLHRVKHYFAFQVCKDFLHMFEKIVHFHDSDSEGWTPSYWSLIVKERRMYSSSVASECVVNGLRTLSRCLTSDLCKMEFTDQKKELLNISCLFGDEEVVKMLLQSGFVPTFDTIRAAACSKTDNVTTLKELLPSRKVDLNEFSQLLQHSIYSCNMNIACFLADFMNNEEGNSKFKEKIVKLLLVRFHTQVKPFIDEFVDTSTLFKNLVTIEIINKIENVAVIAAGHRSSDVIREIVKLKPDCLNDENRDKVLLAAAVWGSADTVNFLIDQIRSDTQKNNWKKSQVLKVAVMFNSANVVQCLLDKGADPNTNISVDRSLTDWFEKKTRLKCLDSDSTLHISAQLGDLHLLKSLVKRNADVNAVNCKGKTPLHDAVIIKEHRKELALFLLENGADIYITDQNKNSALHLAAELGYLDVVTVLFENGAKVNGINNESKTPVFAALTSYEQHLSLNWYKKHQSASDKRWKVVLYLLEHGADPNITDIYNNSVLHTAAKLGNIEIVTELAEHISDLNIKNNEGKTPLFTAVEYKHNHVVFYLLEHGADPNITDSDNKSALHIAAEQVEIEIVKTLIEKGADVNIKSNTLKTPLLELMGICFDEYHQHFVRDPWIIILCLLEHGADCNLTDSDNNSVLHLAAKRRKIEIVTALIEKGADVNIRNNDGETPLLTAINHQYLCHDSRNDEHCAVVFSLLEHGADPNLTDTCNNSVLHIAAMYRKIEIVTALVEKGADVNIRNNDGETPLLTAINHQYLCDDSRNDEHCEVVFSLLEHGADPNLRDSDNNSALHLAAKHGNIEIVTALIEKGVDVNIRNNKGETALFRANQFKVVLYLLEHGADPNLTDSKNNSILHKASKLGNVKIVTALIEKGVDLNIKNNSGETALLAAINHEYLWYDSFNDGRCAVFFYLLEQGADPKITDNDNNSVLHIAPKQKKIEIFKALIEKGFDVNIKNSRGETPLYTAINRYPDCRYFDDKHCEIVLYLLAQGADPNLIDSDNNSLLHLAAEHGKIEIVTSLIEKGVDVNIRNNEGETALFRAVKSYKNKVVLYLLEHGADPNLTDIDNNSVLHIAAKQGVIETLTTLIENCAKVNIRNKEGKTPLLTIINYISCYPYLKAIYCKVVLYLLAHGADPDLTDIDNNSPLHIAAEQRNVEIVTALIERGAKVNIVNKEHKTPLYTAVNYRQNEIVVYLLQHGADPKLKDRYNNSVLHTAAKQGNIEIVTSLIENGVHMNIKNNAGKTPLFTAVHYKQINVVVYLLEHGADPHLKDRRNNSVLHIAAEEGNTEIVRALINKNVDVNIKNKKGKTPLLTAVNRRQSKIVLYLLEHGANPNVIDNDKNSALHVAAKRGLTAVVKALVEKGVDVNTPNARGQTPLEMVGGRRREKQKIVSYLLSHSAKEN